MTDDLPMITSLSSVLSLPLVYELLLLASLALLISWFMGRSFCKSKEYPLRASNSSLKKENKRLETALGKKEAKQQELIEKLRTEQDQVSELAHHNDRDKHIISTLKKEQVEVLETAQSLSSYKLQFEQLNLSHNAQSKQLIGLKSNQKQAEKLEKTMENLTQENKKIGHLNADKSEEIKQLMQQIKTDKGVMTVLEKEQQETLNTVQRLSAYKTQFEQLTQYHNEQSKQVVDLKKSKQQKVGGLEQEIQKIADLNTHKDEKIKQLTQQVEKDKISIAVFKQAQEESSSTISSLSAYKTQFEQLTQHHEELSKQVIDLKTNKQQKIGKLERESKKTADINAHQNEEIKHLIQQIKTEKSVITVLEKEQQETLNTVQRLSAYKTQFEQLTQYHDEQSKQVVNLTKSKQQNVGILEQEVQKIADLNTDKSEKIKQLTRKIEKNKTSIAVLKQAQEESSSTISSLNAYKTQFEQLTLYHEALSKQVIDVKISKQKKVEELERESKKITDLNHHQSEQIQALEQQLAVYSEVATSSNIKITNMLNGFSTKETE